MSFPLAYSLLEPEPEPDYIKKAKKNTRPQKRHSAEYDSAKVNETMQNIKNIHTGTNKPSKQPLFKKYNDTADNFNPPNNPISAGSLKLNPVTENMVGMDMSQVFDTNTPQPASSYEYNSSIANSSEYLSDSATEQANQEYYRANLPTYKNINQPVQYSSGDTEQLTRKINYMINLLEEQRDVKTQNITEEIIMYSFLGVFMIFIVDSFSKVGKYVR